MSNAGRFIDRSPIICAAGKPSEGNTNVPVGYNKLPIVENVRHWGTDDFILEHLSRPIKARYQELITDLKESTYGDAHGVEELLKPGCEPSIYKRDTLSRMSSLSLLWQTIKERFSPTFTLINLSDSLAYYDQEETDFITLRDFYDVLAYYQISLHEENIQALLQDLHIIQGGKINYKKFVDVLNFSMELEKQLDPRPKDNLYYVSQSTSANLDRCDISNCSYSMNCAAAGLPSHRNDEY